MIRRVLVAIADSPASLAAARGAIELARCLSGEIRALHVVVDGTLAELLRSSRPQAPVLRPPAAAPVLRHVAELAERAGVPVQTVQDEGDVAARILAHARAWDADLIVIGRTTRHGTGEPFIGVEAQRVLEFSDRPVLVIPPGGPHQQAGDLDAPRSAAPR